MKMIKSNLGDFVLVNLAVVSTTGHTHVIAVLGLHLKATRAPEAAPPSTKLLSSTLYKHLSSRFTETTLPPFPLWSEYQQSTEGHAGVWQHEVPEQPGRQPPDRAGGAGQHGKRSLGQPRLLWLSSGPASSCQHHLQPPAPLPGLYGQYVQTGHPRPIPRGTNIHRPKSGEETKRLLLFYQRWELIQFTSVFIV